MAEKKVRNPVEQRQRKFEKEASPSLNQLQMLLGSAAPVAYDRHLRTPIIRSRLPKGVAGTTTSAMGVGDFQPGDSVIAMPKKSRFNSIDEYTNEYGKSVKHEILHALQNISPDDTQAMASFLDETSLSPLESRRNSAKRNFTFGSPGHRERMPYLVNRDMGFNDRLAETTKIRQPNRPLDGPLNKILEALMPSPKREYEDLRTLMMNKTRPQFRSIIEKIVGPVDPSWGEDSLPPE